jgi:hypothetical protein
MYFKILLYAATEEFVFTAVQRKGNEKAPKTVNNA